MKAKLLFSKPYSPVFTNSLDAFVPELWAQESLMILENNLVAAQLVHRDFENQIANYGDVVNTRQPATFESKRKTDADDVSVQNATATNVPVTLDQHHHVSFIIKDGEQSKGFKNLVTEYLAPAIQAVAQAVDQSVLVQCYQFLGNVSGYLGTALTVGTIADSREVMTNKKVPLVGRNMILTPNQEGQLLQVAAFTEADKVADGGAAIREANMGRRFGFNLFVSQNAPSIAAGNTIVASTSDPTVHSAKVNGAKAAGSTSITIDDTSATVVAGSWCKIAGDAIPQQITAVSGTPTTGLTISPGLKRAVANDALITIYSPGAVNQTTSPTGYAANYAKEIVVDGFTVAPKSGQLVTFGTATDKYGAINTPTTTGIWLDRCLAAAIANDAAVGVGPAGEYGFAFHKNALALVCRPLATAIPGTGALSSIANANGLGVRVTITYNGTSQGHLVTVDLLCGIKVLNSDLGAVVLS